MLWGTTENGTIIYEKQAFDIAAQNRTDCFGLLLAGKLTIPTPPTRIYPCPATNKKQHSPFHRQESHVASIEALTCHSRVVPPPLALRMPHRNLRRLNPDARLSSNASRRNVIENNNNKSLHRSPLHNKFMFRSTIRNLQLT